MPLTHCDLIKLEKSQNFIRKLYMMVDDPATNHVVRWTKNCDAFIVFDFCAFKNTVLTQYFPDVKYISYHRYLNKYGFFRLNAKHETIRVFGHPYFKRGEFDLLRKLKLSQSKSELPFEWERPDISEVGVPDGSGGRAHVSSQNLQSSNEDSDF